MAKIKVLAGDFGKGSAMYMWGSITLPNGRSVSASQLASVEIATEKNVKSVLGTVGLGALGGVVFGPIGAVAGVLAGGRGKQVTFVARFKDGNKFLGTANEKTFKKLMAAAF